MATMEDIARLRLEILGDEAEKTVESLNDGLKEVNDKLKLMEVNGEKGSETWRELKRVQKDIKDDLKELNQNIDLNDMSWNQLNNRARQLRGELNNLTIGSEEWIAKLKQISEVDEKIGDTREEMKRLKGEGESQEGFWTSFKANFTAAFAWDMVKEAASAVFDFGMEVFNMTSKFEKYETVLKTALGGQQEAIAAMEMIKEVAATTPVSVDEMTNSFIKFVGAGVQPTQEEIKKLADVAASQGKGFDQLSEAVLDAMHGEGERLKELNIGMSKVGENVELSFKGQTVAVKNNEEAIYQAIVAMGDYQGVAGMTSEMSATLEGRTSNLGDKFDFLMVALGEKLKPAFIFILDLLSQTADWFSEVVNSSDPLLSALGSLWGIIVQIWDIGKTLIFTLFPELQSESVNTGNVMRVLGTILGIVADALKFVVSTVQLSVDAFRVLGSASTIVTKALQGDFEGAKQAATNTGKAWDDLTVNAKKNFSSIGDATAKAWDAGVKGAKDAGAAVDIYGKLAKKTEEDHTKISKAESDKRKKEADKEAADRVKANADATKRIQDANVAAIKNETDKKIAAEKLKYDREKERIDKSKADEKLKAQEVEALTKAHKTALEKIDIDHKAKLKAEEDKKAAAEEKARKDKETAQKKANETALKDEKTLFDAQFQAFAASKNLEFNLAKTTTAQKIELLRQEAQFHRDKLEMEAAHQKAKIATEIADETQRAALFKSIDEKLAADLKASDAKLQADKSKQLADAHKQRQDNTKQFFDALEGMAKGDFTAFMTFLNNKVKNEATANQQRLKDFANKGTETLAVAAQVVNVMQTLNDTFTKRKLGLIEKEKTEQLKSWETQYKSGKMSKEEYEAGVSKINKEAAQKEHEAKVKAWKRDQVMQIAMAVINGATAALKSLATMGFPLGLIGVAASAVMTGVQIGIIKNQKPPEAPSFKSGGYVKNAGVPQGSRHGSQYGQSGIALWDRNTGQEIGEMEGGEPIMILSRSTYENNGDVIDKLLNSSLHRNGARIFQKGGIHGEGGSYMNYLEPLQAGQMYLFGSRRRKRAYEDGGMVDEGSIIPDTQGMDSDTAATTATSQAAIEASQKVQQQIADNTLKTTEQIDQMLGLQSEANGLLVAIKDKPSGISLHDLNGALASHAAVSSRSNL